MTTRRLGIHAEVLGVGRAQRASSETVEAATTPPEEDPSSARSSPARSATSTSIARSPAPKTIRRPTPSPSLLCATLASPATA